LKRNKETKKQRKKKNFAFGPEFNLFGNFRYCSKVCSFNDFSLQEKRLKERMKMKSEINVFRKRERDMI